MVPLMAISCKWNGGDQNGMEMELWPMAENGNCPFPFCPEHCTRGLLNMIYAGSADRFTRNFVFVVNLGVEIPRIYHEQDVLEHRSIYMITTLAGHLSPACPF